MAYDFKGKTAIVTGGGSGKCAEGEGEREGPKAVRRRGVGEQH